MKIVVVGASGLIGTKTVDRLRKQGHEVVPASRSSGVNTVTGDGLKAALQGADVVVDVSNAPSWEAREVMEFFRTSTRNLLAAEKAAGVKHHIALSVVGTARLLDSGYFRAKMAQEDLIKAGNVPYTIIQATQFFEFLGGIADSGANGDSVRLSSAYMQPISADDVVLEIAGTCSRTPANETIEIAGPERVRISEIVGRYLNAINDGRKVVADDDALYFGIKLNDKSLVPSAAGRLSPTSFDEWVKFTAKNKN
jgi:uncharacterized protein YbjT (DUF2867 family)